MARRWALTCAVVIDANEMNLQLFVPTTRLTPDIQPSVYLLIQAVVYRRGLSREQLIIPWGTGGSEFDQLNKSTSIIKQKQQFARLKREFNVKNDARTPTSYFCPTEKQNKTKQNMKQ